MFFLKKIGCRLFQAVFRIAIPFLPYREPHLLFSREALGEVLEQKKPRGVLLVTSEGSRKRGQLAPVEELLREKEIPFAVYDKTKPNPTEENVEEALALYQKTSCDTLIALGGGSAIDCAKGVGGRVAYPKKRLCRLAGVMRVLRPIPTLIAIPTTAGTGSETTLAAVITGEEEHRKYALMSFPLIPHYALMDEALTRTMPPPLTATTGMDALTHAVEAYIGKATTKKTRRLAEEAVGLILKNLEIAYRDGENKKAREAMLLASYKAGVAFSVSYVGYVHALAHALGGAYDTPHGLANAVLLPHVLTAYGKSAHKKLCRLAVATGLCSPKAIPAEGAAVFLTAIKELNGRLGIPATLEALREEDIPRLAFLAAKEANPLYPVPRLMEKEELERVYRKIAPSS